MIVVTLLWHVNDQYSHPIVAQVINYVCVCAYPSKEISENALISPAIVTICYKGGEREMREVRERDGRQLEHFD